MEVKLSASSPIWSRVRLPARHWLVQKRYSACVPADWRHAQTNMKKKKETVPSAFLLHSILYHYPQLQLSRILNYFYCFVMFCTNKLLWICIYSYLFIDIYRLIQYAIQFCRTHFLSTCYFSTLHFFEKKWKLSARGIRELFKLNHN